MKTRDDIMLPFRILSDATLRHASGAAIYLQQRAGINPGDEMARDAAVNELLSSLSTMPDSGWSVSRHFGTPAHMPEPEPDFQTGDIYHARLAAAEGLLVRAGVDRAASIHSAPAGWVRIMEQAAQGIADRMSIEGDDASVSILDIKEKFGTLRFYVRPSGGSGTFCEDILDIASWAEGASEGRCMVTGKPGSQDAAGWILTLSDPMKNLRKNDQEAFGHLIYPKAPTADADAPTP